MIELDRIYIEGGRVLVDIDRGLAMMRKVAESSSNKKEHEIVLDSIRRIELMATTRGAGLNRVLDMEGVQLGSVVEDNIALSFLSGLTFKIEKQIPKW